MSEEDKYKKMELDHVIQTGYDQISEFKSEGAKTLKQMNEAIKRMEKKQNAHICNLSSKMKESVKENDEKQQLLRDTIREDSKSAWKMLFVFISIVTVFVIAGMGILVNGAGKLSRKIDKKEAEHRKAELERPSSPKQRSLSQKDIYPKNAELFLRISILACGLGCHGRVVKRRHRWPLVDKPCEPVNRKD